jgi:hypothetical protein
MRAIGAQLSRWPKRVTCHPCTRIPTRSANGFEQGHPRGWPSYAYSGQPSVAFGPPAHAAVWAGLPWATRQP